MKESSDIPESLNSMQETIRSFDVWFNKHRNSYVEEIHEAADVFWGDRPGLASIEESEANIMLFHEWLMLDFPVNGYDDVPAHERKNFLDLFLAEAGASLSNNARIFAENIRVSYPSVYEVTSIVSGMCIGVRDCFSGEAITVWDKNISSMMEKGLFLFGRFSKDEKGKYIGSGSRVIPLFEDIAQELVILIRAIYVMTKEDDDQGTLEDFLKWNSYLYYREAMERIEEAVRLLGARRRQRKKRTGASKRKVKQQKKQNRTNVKDDKNQKKETFFLKRKTPPQDGT